METSTELNELKNKIAEEMKDKIKEIQLYASLQESRFSQEDIIVLEYTVIPPYAVNGVTTEARFQGDYSKGHWYGFDLKLYKKASRYKAPQMALSFPNTESLFDFLKEGGNEKAAILAKLI